MEVWRRRKPVLFRWSDTETKQNPPEAHVAEVTHAEASRVSVNHHGEDHDVVASQRMTGSALCQIHSSDPF